MTTPPPWRSAQEAVPHLAKISAANPNRTELSKLVAALQAWFGLEKDLDATCLRALAYAKGKPDSGTLERMAKACSLSPSQDKTRLEAALALARMAVERGKTSPSLPWFQLTRGMAEYRNGHFAEADAALQAAAKGSRQHPQITGISAFYRAMSLYRLGKHDEARKLLTAAAANMKPLPNDAKNPMGLEGNVNHDDLILWMASKEAKALIKFTIVPPPKVENGKK